MLEDAARVIAAGTAISTRRRDEPNSYNFLTIDAPCLLLSVRGWDGQRFAQASEVQFTRQDGLWR